MGEANILCVAATATRFAYLPISMPSTTPAASHAFPTAAAQIGEQIPMHFCILIVLALNSASALKICRPWGSCMYPRGNRSEFILTNLLCDINLIEALLRSFALNRPQDSLHADRCTLRIWPQKSVVNGSQCCWGLAPQLGKGKGIGHLFFL